MNHPEYKPMTIGNWIITFIILAIPLVNLIMLIVWALGGSTHPSKKSYCQATLILFGILFGIAIVASLIIPLINHAVR
jgi:hypothetical protein